ncbi:formin-I-like isoform X2 [Pelobates fuscus]|uniref:formin-I-like isoform X2 n=1 Tax=Pelobates fuscus TaxID=191477 RepID=UPI002FE460E7
MLLSQEEILDILNKVKIKQITIDDALALWNQEKKSDEEQMKPENVGSKDPPTTQQYNFTVYKQRYRRKKRILQIDLISQMIFNIEKGNLKNQFPFTQIKSCFNGDGLKLVISFYGHHDYEIEASSLEDKENLVKIMNDIIQDNGQLSTVKSFAKRNAYCDVILDGLLERQEQRPGGETWNMCLVKLKRQELVYYCAQEKLQPVENIINLSECYVYSSGNSDSPSFTIHTKGGSLVFRIPLNEQTRNRDKSLGMRDDWVSLLQEYSSHNPPSSLNKCNSNSSEVILDIKSNQTTPEPLPPDLLADNKIQNNLKTSNVSDTVYSSILSDKIIHQEDTSKPEISITQSLPQCRISPILLPPPLPEQLHKLNNSRNIQKRTKAFHWDIVLQERVNKSMWALQNADPKKIDTQRIMNLFQCHEFTVSADNSSDLSKNLNILLNSKIAHNFNIVLKSFHMAPVQLKDKLFIINESDGGLSDEHLTNLRRYVPTKKDVIMYQNFKGSPHELHIVDQFMLEMCKIPDLCKRLDTLLAIRELSSYMQDLNRLLSLQVKACEQLLKSQTFPAVLHYILAIGNCLNENAGKEKVKGFRLSSLTKMSQLVSKEKKFTLLHGLVEQILLYEPDLVKFPQEFNEFESVPGASVKGLIAEVEVLSKELEKIDEYRKTFKSKFSKGSSSETKFLKDLKIIVETYGTEYAKIAKRSSEMKKIYSDILQKFAEAEDQDSQEMFGWISTFIKEFQNVVSQIRDLQN